MHPRQACVCDHQGAQHSDHSAAKNVILAGVKSVRLHDPSPVEARDLGSHFYLDQSDIGKPTAAACKAKLQELNTAVNVYVVESISNKELQDVQVCVDFSHAAVSI